MEVDGDPLPLEGSASVSFAKRRAEEEPVQESKRVRRAPPKKHDYLDDDSDGLASDADSQYSLRGSSISQKSPSAHTSFTRRSTAGSSKYPSELKNFPCPHSDCDKAFNRPARLKEHLRSHNNDRVFKCPFDGCVKDFLRDSHLSHHIKSAHTEIRDYVCNWHDCGKAFVTATRLRRHIAAHEGHEKYRCSDYPPCNEVFRKHATLQRHIASAHLGQKPFRCTHVDMVTGEHCRDGFETAGKLKAHEGRAHGGARFFCTECSEPDGEGVDVVSYSSYAELRSHIRIAHPPTCPHCSEAYSTAKELRRHLELFHGGADTSARRIYMCTYPSCGKGFTKNGNLKVHIRTVHEGERRFICGETDLSNSTKVQDWNGEGACGNKFSAKMSLEEHVRTAHMGLPSSKSKGKPRKQKKRKETARATSLLASLTGAGYGEENGRHIPCLVPECGYRFYREYDMQIHLVSLHGIPESDVRGVLSGILPDPINNDGILWTDYDQDVDMDEGMRAQEELNRQYEEMMHLGVGERNQPQVTEDPDNIGENVNMLVDPILRYTHSSPPRDVRGS